MKNRSTENDRKKKREPKLSFRFPKPTANSFPVGIIPPVTVFDDILIQAAAVCFDLSKGHFPRSGGGIRRTVIVKNKNL